MRKHRPMTIPRALFPDDTETSRSRQHYTDTGRYLPVTEAPDAAALAWLDRSACLDAARPALFGAGYFPIVDADGNCDAGALVTTDGHRLHLVVIPEPPEGGTARHLAGAPAGARSTDSPVDFPDVAHVIPDTFTPLLQVTDRKAFTAAVRKLRRRDAQLRAGTLYTPPIAIGGIRTERPPSEGEGEVTERVGVYREPFSNRRYQDFPAVGADLPGALWASSDARDGAPVGINPGYLADALDGFAPSSAVTVCRGGDSSLDPICIVQGSRLAVVMPSRVGPPKGARSEHEHFEALWTEASKTPPALVVSPEAIRRTVIKVKGARRG